VRAPCTQNTPSRPTVSRAEPRKAARLQLAANAALSSSGQHSSGRGQGLAASPLGCWPGRSSALGKCRPQQRGAAGQTRETQAPQSTNTARLPVPCNVCVPASLDRGSTSHTSASGSAAHTRPVAFQPAARYRGAWRPSPRTAFCGDPALATARSRAHSGRMYISTRGRLARCVHACDAAANPSRTRGSPNPDHSSRGPHTARPRSCRLGAVRLGLHRCLGLRFRMALTAHCKAAARRRRLLS